jgi:type I restriction enzyme, R subunit
LAFIKIIVERPLRLNFQASPTRLERLTEQNAFAALVESKKRKNKKEIAKDIDSGREQQTLIVDALGKLDPDQLYRNRDQFKSDLDKIFEQAGVKVSSTVYIAERGYTDIRSLVAFSGEVLDPEIPGKKFTETGMNKGVKESELPKKFATEEYQILLVAEKYQTGFDQPLLHTMYVDKRLAGVQAVQTLSRLNRTAPGKTDTFVLDFVNEREDIYKSFKPYYEITDIGAMPDPQQLYKLQHEVKESPVINPVDIVQFSEIWFRNRKESTPGEHKQLNAILDQAVERFNDLDEAGQDEFKVKLVSFRNLYAFLSQIIPYQDSDLEQLYTYARFLLLKLPRRKSGLGYDVEDEVALRFYRLQKISEGKIDLSPGEAEPLKGPTEVGTGNYDDKSVVLSQLIDKLNDRFGTDFKPADQLFFDQVTEAAIENETLKTAAQVNTLDNFGHVFERMLEGLFIDRMEGNEEIFDRIMQDASFRDAASTHLMREVYDRLRAREKAPSAER